MSEELDTLISKRKAIAICNQGAVDKLYSAIAELGWDCYDDVTVEIAGSSVYGIPGAGTKWAPLEGTVKYNKDAFIVIKNQSRNPVVPSQPNPELKAHHAES
jgi:hypothetical protein|tara:strand:- start:1474 stop:1779 length:306 start_codon:yes stop_codon:yes gene_type:complete